MQFGRPGLALDLPVPDANGRDRVRQWHGHLPLPAQRWFATRKQTTRRWITLAAAERPDRRRRHHAGMRLTPAGRVCQLTGVPRSDADGAGARYPTTIR
jgi:hypothetical protein